MTSGSFLGTVYNTRPQDPSSLVSLDPKINATCNTSTNGVNTYYIDSPTIGLADETTPEIIGVTETAISVQELPLLGMDWETIGTESFVLDNDGDITHNFIIGTKKVSNGIYRIYYVTIVTVSGDVDFEATNFKVHRIEVDVINGGYVDTILQDYPLDSSTSNWALQRIQIIGKVAHIGIIRCYPNLVFQQSGYDVYIYKLDMDTEIVTGGIEYTSGIYGYGGNRKRTDEDIFNTKFGNALKFGVSSGVLYWITAHNYTDDGSVGLGTYVVLNGTEIQTSDTGEILNLTETPIIKDYQWNSRDFLFSIEWKGRWNIEGVLTYYIQRDFITQDGYVGIESKYSIPSPTFDYIIYSPWSKCRAFISIDTFPAISYNTLDGKFYNVNPATGVQGSEFSVSGKTIKAIFPTLDTEDGSIYVSDIDGILYGVDAGGNFTKTFSVEILPATAILVSQLEGVYNHGNMLMGWRDSGATTVYYLKMDERNELLMIVEQN